MSAKTDTPRVERFNAGGFRIYRLRLQAFPDFYAHAHLVLGADTPTLIDVGSGWADSNDDLLAGFAELQGEHGEKVSLADVGRIIITHGHLDHFGGLAFVREHTRAPIGVHALDRRVLTNFEERVVLAAKSLRTFLIHAGLDEKRLGEMMQMYTFAKGLYHSVPVDFTLREDETVAEGFRFIHVPGHCPGQVCVQLADVLFTADHVLSRITPHQSPESITRNVGLGHYFDSLRKVRDLPGVNLCLGGHQLPIRNLAKRVDEIRRSHERRLSKVLQLCAEPTTVKDVSRSLFGAVNGYNVLLALQETGAHIEYLYQRGELAVANLEEVENAQQPAVLYHRV